MVTCRCGWKMCYPFLEYIPLQMDDIVKLRNGDVAQSTKIALDKSYVSSNFKMLVLIE